MDCGTGRRALQDGREDKGEDRALRQAGHGVGKGKHDSAGQEAEQGSVKQDGGRGRLHDTGIGRIGGLVRAKDDGMAGCSVFCAISFILPHVFISFCIKQRFLRNNRKPSVTTYHRQGTGFQNGTQSIYKKYPLRDLHHTSVRFVQTALRSV